MRKCSIIPWFIRICKGVAALYYTYSGIKYLLRSNIVPERVYSETDKRRRKDSPFDYALGDNKIKRSRNLISR